MWSFSSFFFVSIVNDIIANLSFYYLSYFTMITLRIFDAGYLFPGLGTAGVNKFGL